MHHLPAYVVAIVILGVLLAGGLYARHGRPFRRSNRLVSKAPADNQLRQNGLGNRAAWAQEALDANDPDAALLVLLAETLNPSSSQPPLELDLLRRLRQLALSAPSGESTS